MLRFTSAQLGARYASSSFRFFPLPIVRVPRLTCLNLVGPSAGSVLAHCRSRSFARVTRWVIGRVTRAGVSVVASSKFPFAVVTGDPLSFSVGKSALSYIPVF